MENIIKYLDSSRKDIKELPSTSKETVVINFFAGPSTGKTTHSVGLFYRLKSLGINCEYVSEFAKDKTWEDHGLALQCQPYIFGKQTWKLFRLLGKVRVIITDSPVLLSCVYQGFGSSKSFNKSVVKTFNLFNNLNYYLERDQDRKYLEHGRSQTKEESINKDNEIFDLLNKLKIDYNIKRVQHKDFDSTVDEILYEVLEVLEKQDEEIIDNTMLTIA